MTCPVTTFDGISREPVRCALPAGHSGSHEGGCIRWSDKPPQGIEAYSHLPRDVYRQALNLRRDLAVALGKTVERGAKVPGGRVSTLVDGLFTVLDTHLPDAILAAYQAGKKGSDGR